MDEADESVLVLPAKDAWRVDGARVFVGVLDPEVVMMGTGWVTGTEETEGETGWIGEV